MKPSGRAFHTICGRALANWRNCDALVRFGNVRSLGGTAGLDRALACRSLEPDVSEVQVEGFHQHLGQAFRDVATVLSTPESGQGRERGQVPQVAAQVLVLGG